MSELLAEMAPYRLPEPSIWWPVAPMVWLAIALLMGLFLLLLLWRRRARRHRLRNLALNELKVIERNRSLQAEAEAESLRALSALLRRCALRMPQDSSHPAIAELSGDRWLLFLDSVMGGTGFRSGCGQVLGNGQYQKKGQDVDWPALFSLSRRWIKAVSSKARHEGKQNGLGYDGP